MRVPCGDVYRFLLSPRWIGLGLLMTLAAAIMVGLGLWQLDRFHGRSAINARIDAAAAAAPVPLQQVLTAPGSNQAGAVGAAPAANLAWTRVIISGRYDPSHEILARSRTVDRQVGFEILTPLVLTDGSAVLIDRGWVAPSRGGANVPPMVPAAPAGEVTVVGRVHAPESSAGPAEPFHGGLAVRRIAPERLAQSLPYPLYGAYVTLDVQTPPADATFVAITPNYENAGMNAGYAVQWWLFAALTLVGFGYLAVRERRGQADGSAPGPADERVTTPAAPRD